MVVSAAQRLLLARVALMFASLELSIFVLALTVFTWYMEDDSLQKWCDRSAFGLVRNKLSDRYMNSDSQEKALIAAIKDVM
jgi:hypothetical protein